MRKEKLYCHRLKSLFEDNLTSLVILYTNQLLPIPIYDETTHQTLIFENSTQIINRV